LLSLIEANRDVLLDHLVGASDERSRDSDPHGSSRLEVDSQLELGGLQNRSVCGLLAFEHPSCVAADIPPLCGVIGGESDKPARLHRDITDEDGGHPMTHRDSGQNIVAKTK
jgi:hypothetical protein